MDVPRASPARSLLVAGRPIQVTTRVSPRARSLRVVVRPGRPVEVVVPRGARLEEVNGFLEQKARWIESKVAWARDLAERRPSLGLDRPGVVWRAGVALPVVRTGERRPWARVRGGALAVGSSGDDAVGAVARWYRRTAHEAFGAAVAREGARLGVGAVGVSVRDPSGRWGSCSRRVDPSSCRRVNVSFSWRLVLAPPPILDHVVVHELCHVRVTNHSKRFWSLMDRARPDHWAEGRWLDEHGFELHDYDPVAALAG